jgi:hypothetical protein
MFETLLAPAFLFRFSAPCYQHADVGSAKGCALGEKHRLPCFGELEDKPLFADLRAGWSEAGLAFQVRVEGKKQPLWCRDSRIEDSDGLQIWVDTRNTQNIHRAGRFCHRFVFLPIGSGRKLDEPMAALLAINRARESPREIEPDALRVRSERRIDGYSLEAFIAADALTGFSPGESPALGFTYALADRELGTQTFSVGPEFPFSEDPSLWGTLDLVK